MSPEPSRLAIDARSERSFDAVGIIDSHTAPGLLDRLRSAGFDRDIRLDLSRVEFIDSSGLRALVTSHQDLEGNGNKLILTGISDAVDRLFDITGLREHLHFA